MTRPHVSPYFVFTVTIVCLCCLLPTAGLLAQEERIREDRIGDRKIGAAISILDFEQFGVWSRGDEPWGSFTQSDSESISGAFSGMFSYSFPAVEDNYIVFRQTVNIPSRPNGLRIQVYGNGSTHFLNAWVQDATDQYWQFTFGRINHVGWQTMYAPLDLSLGWPNQAIYRPSNRGVVYPIRLAALVLDGHASDQASQGIVYVDDLEAITFADSPYISDALLPDEAPERPVAISGAVATINVRRLNVRSGPGTSYPILTGVSEGQTLNVVAQDVASGWYQIETEEGPGWISGAYANVENIENLTDTSLVISDTVIANRVDLGIVATTSITASGIITPTSIQTQSIRTLKDAIGSIAALSTADLSLAVELLPGRIAFPSFAGGSYAIYVVRADGSNLKRIAGNASQPALSSDGQRVAFRNWEKDKRGLAVIDTSGGQIRQLTGRPEDALPDWGPDGETLVFFSRREGDRRSRIYQVSVTNRNEWQLADVGGEYPDWMPDGRILYRATRPQIALAIMDNDGTNPIELVADGEAIAPAISPDGESVLFMSRQDDNWDIFLTDLAGDTPKQLTTHSGNDGLPVWSPDGQHVAFVTDRDGTWGIWVMNRDGSQQRKLLPIPGSLDGFMPDEPAYSFRGWQEERISWSR